MQNPRKSGRVTTIPANKDKANKFLLHFAKLFEQNMKKSNSYNTTKRSRNDYLQSLKYTPSPLDSKSKNYSENLRNIKQPNIR